MRLIRRRRFPVDHYVLVDDAGLGEAEDLLAHARRRAELLALQSTGNAQNFTLIHNGAGLARCPAAHVHIVCTRSCRGKALVYLMMGLKNLLGVRAAHRH